MKETIAICVIAAAALLPATAPAGSPPMAAISAVKPIWNIGDWWVVESQRYDHGENRPGASPRWLEKERWKFSVEGTNFLDGQPAYEVFVKPDGNNQCPYWFTYFFRTTDLLVMRRELHQAASSKTGRAAAPTVVQWNYSGGEESPFVPDDFPNLPITTPHFTGGATNSYHAAASAKSGQSHAGSMQASARSSADSLTQTFHSGERLDFVSPNRSNSRGLGADTSVITLSTSADKFERQNWDQKQPWHLYAEQWEAGDLSRKSWLVDYGNGLQKGGTK